MARKITDASLVLGLTSDERSALADLLYGLVKTSEGQEYVKRHVPPNYAKSIADIQYEAFMTLGGEA